MRKEIYPTVRLVAFERQDQKLDDLLFGAGSYDVCSVFPTLSFFKKKTATSIIFAAQRGGRVKRVPEVYIRSRCVAEVSFAPISASSRLAAWPSHVWTRRPCAWLPSTLSDRRRCTDGEPVDRAVPVDGLQTVPTGAIAARVTRFRQRVSKVSGGFAHVSLNPKS